MHNKPSREILVFLENARAKAQESNLKWEQGIWKRLHGSSYALGINILSILTPDGKYRINLKEGKTILITVEYEKELLVWPHWN